MILLIVLAVLISAIVALPTITVLFALVASLRQRLLQRRRVVEGGARDHDGKRTSSSYRTAPYVGRVWHRRHQPVSHGFAYPLFFMGVDLDEASDLFGGSDGGGSSSGRGGRTRGSLWPLSVLMNLQADDHLKNGEGQKEDQKVERGEGKENDDDGGGGSIDTLKPRLFRLIERRTNGKYRPEPTQRVLLLTHLRYYGYCFNPVSLYYVLKGKEEESGPNSKAARDASSSLGGEEGSGQRTNEERRDEDEIVVEAVVAEVSNTPWNEMTCYVLHPDSVDVRESCPGPTRTRTTTRGGNDGSTAAAAATAFSYGRDMDASDARDGNGKAEKRGTTAKLQEKEEREQEEEKKEGAQSDDDDDTTHASASAGDGSEQRQRRRRGDWSSVRYVFDKTFHVSPFMTMDHAYDWSFWLDQDAIAVTAKMMSRSTHETYFTAGFDIDRQPLSPWTMCYHLLRWPVYCAIVQVWIHVEAFALFFKGVEFVPHPEGSETVASRIIAGAMGPFFAAKGWWEGQQKDAGGGGGDRDGSDSSSVACADGGGRGTKGVAKKRKEA